jgi:AcrR family transcriptional regulator
MSADDVGLETTGRGWRGGSVRAEQKQRTRERLIWAARTVFENKGYGAASIGDITAECQVHRATFYIHFADKAECLLAALDELIAQTVVYWRDLDKALVAGTPAAIREWLANIVHWWERHGALLTAWEEARAVDLKIAARVKSQFDGLSSEMHGYLGRFETQQERDDAQQMVVNLIFMIDGYLFRAVVQRVLDGDREHMLDLLTDMWCGALHLGEAAD